MLALKMEVRSGAPLQPPWEVQPCQTQGLRHPASKTVRE